MFRSTTTAALLMLASAALLVLPIHAAPMPMVEAFESGAADLAAPLEKRSRRSRDDDDARYAYPADLHSRGGPAVDDGGYPYPADQVYDEHVYDQVTEETMQDDGSDYGSEYEDALRDDYGSGEYAEEEEQPEQMTPAEFELAYRQYLADNGYTPQSMGMTKAQFEMEVQRSLEQQNYGQPYPDGRMPMEEGAADEYGSSYAGDQYGSSYAGDQYGSSYAGDQYGSSYGTDEYGSSYGADQDAGQDYGYDADQYGSSYGTDAYGSSYGADAYGADDNGAAYATPAKRGGYSDDELEQLYSEQVDQADRRPVTRPRGGSRPMAGGPVGAQDPLFAGGVGA